MNRIPKEVRQLIKSANLGQDIEIKTRAKMLHSVVAMVSMCIRVCSASEMGKASWKQIISYDYHKTHQLKDLRKKSDKEYIRQAINYFCYMTYLLNNLDMERKGLLPDGMFSKKLIEIINTESMKHKFADEKS